MKQKYKNRSAERGNVLFLILIAVALFAALSYAVTQSTRSGGGSTEREQSILHGASMTQHPTAIRTSIIRMILGGVDVSDVKFNSPAGGFSGLADTTEGVFHPDGGGAVFQMAPADLMAGSSQGDWFYNASFDVPEIGRDGIGGNDIIAFLPNITQIVCRQINDEFSIDATGCVGEDVRGVPNLNLGTALIKVNMDDTYTFPTGDEEDLQGASCTAFTANASGCFYDATTSEYVFYSVLLER